MDYYDQKIKKKKKKKKKKKRNKNTTKIYSNQIFLIFPFNI